MLRKPLNCSVFVPTQSKPFCFICGTGNPLLSVSWGSTRVYNRTPGDGRKSYSKKNDWFAKAPATRNKGYVDPGLHHHMKRIEIPSERSKDTGRVEPFEAYLDGLIRAGVVKMDLENAWNMIWDLTQTTQEFESICKKYGKTVDEIVELANVISRNIHSEYTHVGQTMLERASSERNATATVLQFTTSSNNPPEYRKILIERLKHHASTSSDAATILGQIAEKRRQPSQAIKMYEQAVQLYQNRSETTVRLLPLPNPNLLLGELYLDRGDIENAQKSFTSAALEGDDPYAYYLLSEMTSPGNEREKGCYTSDWLRYVTKSASSGHAISALALGEFYIKSDDILEQGGTEKECFEVRDRLRYNKGWGWRKIDGCIATGLEWLDVALRAGYLDAGVSLSKAIEGDISHGQKWSLRSRMRIFTDPFLYMKVDALRFIINAPRSTKAKYPEAVRYAEEEMSSFREETLLLMEDFSFRKDIRRNMADIR